MDRRSRRRRLAFVNRRWSVGLSVSVCAVVLGMVGIAVLGGPWVYAGLVVSVVGAITAMMQTIVRNVAGDEIDEAEL